MYAIVVIMNTVWRIMNRMMHDHAENQYISWNAIDSVCPNIPACADVLKLTNSSMWGGPRQQTSLAHVGPTWILSAPRWANVGPTCLVIWGSTQPRPSSSSSCSVCVCRACMLHDYCKWRMGWWMIDWWLIDYNDWLIDWLIDWLTEYMTIWVK